MSKCNYCGRENKEAAGPCQGCGTPLEEGLSSAPTRDLTVRERKRGWVAVGVAGICGLVGWILAWRTSQILLSVGEMFVVFGATCAVLTLAELRDRKGNSCRFRELYRLRTLGHEDTFFVILHLGPLSFAGWQIVAIETLFALLTAIFVFVGVYAFTPSHNA